jgi:hypothetical protein
VKHRTTLLVLLAAGLVGCGYTTPALRGQPYDAVIVPGCPGERDGSLSECQTRRAAWAAIIWERGGARNFITSGAAVHSPYVEAQQLAAAMAAMGVPAERIYLDPDALHTDENMYNSMRISHRLGLRRLAVASDRGQASGGCSMITGWRQPCTPLNVELRPTYAMLRAAADRLRRVRTAPISPWRPLREVERDRELLTGRRRPPSALLYPWMWVLRIAGKSWTPHSPGDAPIINWSDWMGSSRNVQPCPWRGPS